MVHSVETERETVLYSKHFVTSQKCPYHVTFDLDLDLEHNLDAGSRVDHHVQVWWRSSHFCGRRSDLRKKVYRRTDRQTDGRRTPRDCISSWNELKTKSKNVKRIPRQTWSAPTGARIQKYTHKYRYKNSTIKNNKTCLIVF